MAFFVVFFISVATVIASCHNILLKLTPSFLTHFSILPRNSKSIIDSSATFGYGWHIGDLLLSNMIHCSSRTVDTHFCECRSTTVGRLSTSIIWIFEKCANLQEILIWTIVLLYFMDFSKDTFLCRSGSWSTSLSLNLAFFRYAER